MNLVTYPVITHECHERYEFLSEGPNGTIKKMVHYQRIGSDFYNLAFGDWDDRGQTFNHKARTNNLDRNKVVATVASTIPDFVKHHPGAIITAKGSTPSRTRLYQMGIASHWYVIGNDFHVKGFYKGEWEPFIQGRNYEAFLLKPR